ncbi:MAG: hypothetical protein Q7T18_07085 [Sedimentisphaerales bacterium]|nr:hypothetical protein [Sedimentisphaerales bacterium]
MKNLFMRLLKVYFEDALTLVKIRAVSCYVKAIGAARDIFIAHVTLKCFLLLMLAGFVLMHVGLFIALPCCPQFKGILLLILGAAYFLIALVQVLKMCSQKSWMHYSKASDLVKEVTEKK